MTSILHWRKKYYNGTLEILLFYTGNYLDLYILYSSPIKPKNNFWSGHSGGSYSLFVNKRSEKGRAFR